MDKNYEIVEFKNGEFKLDVSVTPNSDTVWLNVNQMSKLFNKNKSTILRHIKNILAEELDDRGSCKICNYLFSWISKRKNTNS